MENATKALLMGSGVIIGVVLFTVLVYAFRSTGEFASTYDDNIETAVIAKFNEQFISFEGRTNITIHEIISLVNLAENYNEKEQAVVVDVIVDGRSWVTSRVLSEQDKIDELQNNINTYTYLEVEYDEFTRKVNSIKFRHN